jgi:hypothetical protein
MRRVRRLEFLAGERLVLSARKMIDLVPSLTPG